MKIERSKNAKRNIVFGLANKIVTLVLPFVIRTAMIKTLGAEYLGLDSLFGSILQVLNLTELGFSSAIVYSMYKPIADDDTKTVCALLNVYRTIYRYIGAIILIVGLCITPFLPHLINSNPTVGGGVPAGLSLYAIYFVFLGNTVLGYVLFAYKTALPNATQRLDIVTGAHTISTVITKIAQVVILLLFNRAVYNGNSVYYLYLAMLPICTLLNNISVSILVDKYYPQYSCKGRITDETKNAIKIKVYGLLINKICATTRNALDSICISAFLGLTTTTMYNNYFYIITAIRGIMDIFTHSILAGVGNSIAVESIDKNYNDLRRMNYLYMLISGWATVCMVLMYQPFMEIWVGSELMFPFGIVICFSVYFYVLKMGDMRAVYSDAAGLWWENRYRAIAESVVNIVLNLLLVKFWGVYGIILATLISLFVINFGFGSGIVFKYYFKNNKIREYFLDHAKYFFVTAFVCLLTMLLAFGINGIFGTSNWTVSTNSPFRAFLINGLICTVISSLLYLILYRRSDIYAKSIAWLLPKLKGEKQLSRLLLPKGMDK